MTTNCSDLLPLVAAVLNDKVAADANDEIEKLRGLLSGDVSRSVQIVQSIDRNVENNNNNNNIKNDSIVHASGQFQDGYYSTSNNLWQVDFHKSSSEEQQPPFTCCLADLKSCVVCVGGGFPVTNLQDEPAEGWLNTNESADGEDGVAVVFCVGIFTRLWLTLVVHGWPRVEWEAYAQSQSDRLDAGVSFSYLTDEVATNHPHTTVEFKEVQFILSSLRGGPVQKLLSPERLEEANAKNVLRMYVSSTIQQGFSDPRFSAAVNKRFRDVMGMLNILNINELTEENRELIGRTISSVIESETLNR